MSKFTLPDGTVIHLRDSGKANGTVIKATAINGVATRSVPTQAEIVERVKAELAKSGVTNATVAKAEARERADKIEALEKQAADWRQRALDGRISGLDREIREHLVFKAVQAEAEAERLRRGGTVSAADEAKAALHEAQAAEFDRKAANATDNGVRAYYRDKSREARTLAALARGERADPSGDDRSYRHR